MIASILLLVGRRLLVSVLILLIVSFLLFAVLHVLPVDPAAMSLPPNATLAEIEAKRREMGLDLPLPQQYLIWLSQVLHGNFGVSIHYRRGVLGLVAATLPATIELAALSMIIAACLGSPAGWCCSTSAAPQGAGRRFRLDRAAVDTGIPLGPVLHPHLRRRLAMAAVHRTARSAIHHAARRTGFLLIDELIAGRLDVFWSALKHMILPCLALGIAFSPAIMRVLRSGLIDVYQEDYIHMARLRGLSERRILLRHALKNAVLPTLSLMGVQFGFLFGGTLLVEVIFSYPGLGNLMVDAVRNADLPIIQAVGLAYCVIVLIINTVVDSLYLVLNPKLRIR